MLKDAPIGTVYQDIRWRGMHAWIIVADGIEYNCTGYSSLWTWEQARTNYLTAKWLVRLPPYMEV